jgi:hypothetical protein
MKRLRDAFSAATALLQVVLLLGVQLTDGAGFIAALSTTGRSVIWRFRPPCINTHRTGPRLTCG